MSRQLCESRSGARSGFYIGLVLLVAVFASRATRPVPAALPDGEALLQNIGFEEGSDGREDTIDLDPPGWTVTEGRTVAGRARVIKERPELLRVVGREKGVIPYQGNRMLKIDARVYLKSNIRQFYRHPVTRGKLVQEIALYPYSERYLQQFEIRGKRDPGIEGKKDPVKGVRGQLFALKYSHEKMLLVVTTGPRMAAGSAYHLEGISAFTA